MKKGAFTHTIISLAVVMGVFTFALSFAYPVYAASHSHVRAYAITISSEGVTPSSAVFTGKVNGYGDETSFWFEYGLTQELTLKTTARPCGFPTTLTDVSERVYNLVPGATYYFRAVAENVSGHDEGEIMSVTLPQEPASQVLYTPVRTQQVSIYSTGDTPDEYSSELDETSESVDISANKPAESCMEIITTALPQEATTGDEITYTITYHNGCTQAIQNMALRVVLPEGVSVSEQSITPTKTVQGIGTLYTIGDVPVSGQGSIVIQGTIKNSVQKGDTLTFRSFLMYRDASGTTRAKSFYARANITAQQTFTASVFDSFQGLLGSWVVSVLLLCVVAFLVYWIFFKKNKEKNDDTDDENDVLRA